MLKIYAQHRCRILVKSSASSTLQIIGIAQLEGNLLIFNKFIDLKGLSRPGISFFKFKFFQTFSRSVGTLFLSSSKLLREIQ